jgi:hypothetical protein
MKYLTFIRHSESHRQSGPPAALMEAMGKFVEKSLKDGVLVDTGGLLPSKDGVRVRLEATRAGTTGFVAVDEAKREITGYNPDRMDSYLSELKLPNFKGYFVIRFRQAFRAQGVYQGVLPVPNKSAVTGDAVSAYAQFDTAADPVVEAQVGTSFISIDQARANLDAELPAWELNGKSLDISVITYAQIEAGGKLEFIMGRQPSNWAANWRATPLAQQKSD